MLMELLLFIELMALFAEKTFNILSISQKLKVNVATYMYRSKYSNARFILKENICLEHQKTKTQ